MSGRTRWIRRCTAVMTVTAVALFQACGDKADDTGTSPTPSISITLSPTSASVQQGASTTVTATITAAGGFTGLPSIAITGAPTGVTATPSNIQPSGTTTTVTAAISVAATTAPGTYPITVTASGTGVSSATATFTLTVTAAPASGFALTLSPATLSVPQGASGTTTVNIARTNFPGAIGLSVSGAPTGVTATFNPSSATTNTSELTVSAAANAVVGTATLTITGTATGATTQSVTLPLTITAAAAGGYTLSASPTSLSVPQGASGTSTININRTGGFAGSVSLAVAGAPNGVTASLNPTSTTGNTSTLTVTAAAGATTGNATLTITGTATGVANQTTTVALTVAAAGGSGNVVVDFSTCAPANKPIWLAVQNGTTGWTQVTGVGDVYRFSITQSKGGIAYTTQSSGATTVAVQYLTQAEVSAGTLIFCPVVGGKTLTGTVAGLATGEVAAISMGGASASAPTNGSYTLTGVATGNQDLVAYRSNLLSAGASDKVIIRRDQNIAAGGAIPVLDFGAAEAFNPATATATVTGAGSDQVTSTMLYNVGSCISATLSTNLFASSSFTMRGIPAAQQRTNDYHQILVTAINGTTSFRSVSESFRTLADKTFALGVALPTPTVTVLPAAYKRLQAAVTLPSDYQSNMSLQYSASNRSALVMASFGWLGGSAATLAFPDFAGVSGWQDSWMPTPTTSVTWAVAGIGSNITSAAGTCAEGARVKTAFVTGTI